MNRIAILTGAAAGLGRSLTVRLLRAGWTVYGTTRTQKHWKQLKKNLGGSAKNLFLHQFDAILESKVRAFVSKIYRETGRIDLLINNAGYGGTLKRIEDETLSHFQRHLASNLLSTFLMCKYTLPILKKQKKGWIMNISSMAGKRAVPSMGAYSASKFGVIALSQSIAKENPHSVFKCITVCPGGMNTQMRVRLFGREDASRQQSPDFVADKVMEILSGKIAVPSGGDVVIRHHQISMNPPPEA